MRSRGPGWIKVGLDLVDLPIIFASLVLAYYVRFHSGWCPAERVIPSVDTYLKTFALLSVFWFGILACTGTLAPERGMTLVHVLRIVRAILTGAGLAMMAAFLYRDFSYSRLTIVLGLALTILGLAVWHGLKGWILHAASRKGLGVSRAAIIGDGRLAVGCLDEIERKADPSFQIVGFCGRKEGGLGDRLPELGPRERVDEIVRDHDLDHVIVALPSSASEEILEIVQQLDQTSVRVTLIPDVYALIATSVETGDLMGIPAIHLHPLAIHGIQGQIKRILDFWLSLIGLVFLSPVFAFVALLIKLDSPGPVFYGQERIGLDGRTFRMFKFRSMRVDAESETGPTWAVKDDPRRTRLGGLLRKYSIDELPQLYNVLRGEMSLVGPRPERPAFVEKFKNSVPRYMRRHKVRSGMTGWAQISGLRGQAPIDERTRYDIWYIENWSLWLDLEILFKTVHVTLFNPTGY